MDKKLQVFVSSTYTDLIEERQAAVQAILNAGHIPAGMELFKAGDKSQLETIYKWIDNCDIFMLILGGRYGTIDEISGKSYTQLEYEYATSKKPFFSIILKKSFLHLKASIALNDEEIFEAENITSYNKFKKLVMSKIIKEVNNIDQLSTAIHASLQEYSNNPKIAGWVKSDSLIEYKYDKFEYLTDFLKKSIAYTDNLIPVSQLEVLKKYATSYINGVSIKSNSALYYNFSNIFLYSGIIEDTINSSTGEHVFKMTKKGFEYYKYIMINNI